MRPLIILLLSLLLLSCSTVPKRLIKSDETIRVRKGELKNRLQDRLSNKDYPLDGVSVTTSGKTWKVFGEPTLKGDSLLFFLERDSVHQDTLFPLSEISRVTFSQGHPYGEAIKIGMVRGALVTLAGYVIAVEASSPSAADRWIAYPLSVIPAYLGGIVGGMTLMETGFENIPQPKITYVVEQ